MGILRRFREWREDKDGVLTGPDINAESVDTGEVTIAGTDFFAGIYQRVNALLAYEVESFSDVPQWSHRDAGSSGSSSVTGRPRRLQYSIDGSGSNTLSGVDSSVLATFQSLGAFKVTFSDVSFTNADETNRLRIGVSDQNADVDILNNGNGFFFTPNEVDVLRGVSAGSSVFTTGTLDVDWTSNHDIALEYDGSEVRLFVDGSQEASSSYSTNADFAPLSQITDDSSNSKSETVNFESVTVEPL